jgi:intraflagellar transport protein 172
MLKHSGNLQQASDGMRKVAAIAWSQNGKKIGIANSDKVVLLLDEFGNKKDKVNVKSIEKQSKNFVIRDIAFSADGTLLAIAHSDKMIYVVKIGAEWGEDKKIVNKLNASSSITCMTWPHGRPHEIYYGLADGKIKVGYLKNQKPGTVYATDSYVVNICSSYDSQFIMTGHYDGSVFTYNLQSQAFKKIISYQTIPQSIGAGKNIVVAGNDGKVNFYDLKGNFLNRIDYSKDDDCRDFHGAAVNPNGETVVLGNYNRFYVFNLNSKRNEWEEQSIIKINNYYNVTAMCWKSDGARFLTGNLCGSVDSFDISMRKYRYKDKFEINYISPSQIHILSLENEQKSMISSVRGYEISKVSILKDRYVIGHTNYTLVIGDLQTNKSSEFEWRGGGNEKFDMKNQNLCLIFNAGEVSVIEFGNNEILGTFRTEYVSPNMISAKIKYTNKSKNSKKVIAYMLDIQTISIMDLSSKTTLANIDHDSKVTHLELNANANKLLFKDKKKGLYLYDIAKNQKSTLLDYCVFMQWVPDSEVIVAQNRHSLVIWYSSDYPEKKNEHPIKGNVLDVRRASGKTNVIIQEGNIESEFPLDDNLISFGFALESRELGKCVEILEKQPSQDQEGNWQTLANLAMEENNLPVAERCYAAIGDVPKAKFIRKINKMISEYEEKTGKKDGINDYRVQVQLALLEKQFAKAESLLLDQRESNAVMDFYQELHKWDDVIRVAEAIDYQDIASLKGNYFEWLIETKQEARAAEMRESEGQYAEAIDLYLRSGLPVRAANVITEFNVKVPDSTEEKIVNALINAELFEKAGEYYERKGNAQKALECYVKGNVYDKAVDLARTKNSPHVTKLLEKWGDFLVSQNQRETAINHYIEAGAIKKAISTSISARKWTKAIELLEGQPKEDVIEFYEKIAEYYDDIHQYDLAEKYYIEAGKAKRAFEMYARSKKFDFAKKVAKENFAKEEIFEMYINQAKVFEEKGMFREAEELYIAIRKLDMARQMYQRNNMLDQVIRLVSVHNKDKLDQAHLEVAKTYEEAGKFEKAEHHYIESGNWNYAVDMYQSRKMWEDCIRVCKSNATDRETVEIAKKWNKELGEQQFVDMLKKMNLTDALIEYLADAKQFDEAFDIAKKNSKHKIPDVYLKKALYLEDQQKYKEAEENFILAGKLDEAVTMYCELKDFASAMRICNDPKKMSEISLELARQLVQRKEFGKAEKAFLDAKRPDLAIKMYEKLGSAQDAVRVAKKHSPGMVAELNNRLREGADGGGSAQDIVRSAKLYEDSKDWDRAIDTYLEIGPSHVNDTRELERLWEKAIQIASTYSRDRYQEVLKVVCKRLTDIKSYDKAGDYYETIDMPEHACRCFIASHNFERAQETLARVSDPGIKSKLHKMLQDAKEANYASRGDHEGMLGQDTRKGIDMLVKSGNWSQALDTAKAKDPNLLNDYLMAYLNQVCIPKGQFNDALQALANYGMPNRPMNIDIYRRLIDETFAACEPEEIENLRKALNNFMSQVSEAEKNKGVGKEFARFQLATHLIHYKHVYDKKNLTDLAAKVAVALVRYVDLTTLDKPFYEAGQLALKQKWENIAFVFLNRYLDIYEAIEEKSLENLADNDAFKVTDIPPLTTLRLPGNNHIDEAKKTKIRDWCLKVSLEKNDVIPLPTIPCRGCNSQMFEVS